jgi:hypothetical protein
MDTQKFQFVISSSLEPELVSILANLLMDLKNILSSIVGWSSNIAVSLDHMNEVPAKLEINQAVLSLESLVASYKLIASQRKAIIQRIEHFKSFNHAKLIG